MLLSDFPEPYPSSQEVEDLVNKVNKFIADMYGKDFESYEKEKARYDVAYEEYKKTRTPGQKPPDQTYLNYENAAKMLKRMKTILSRIMEMTKMNTQRMYYYTWTDETGEIAGKWCSEEEKKDNPDRQYEEGKEIKIQDQYTILNGLFFIMFKDLFAKKTSFLPHERAIFNFGLFHKVAMPDLPKMVKYLHKQLTGYRQPMNANAGYFIDFIMDLKSGKINYGKSGSTFEQNMEDPAEGIGALVANPFLTTEITKRVTDEQSEATAFLRTLTTPNEIASVITNGIDFENEKYFFPKITNVLPFIFKIERMEAGARIMKEMIPYYVVMPGKGRKGFGVYKFKHNMPIIVIPQFTEPMNILNRTDPKSLLLEKLLMAYAEFTIEKDGLLYGDDARGVPDGIYGVQKSLIGGYTFYAHKPKDDAGGRRKLGDGFNLEMDDKKKLREKLVEKFIRWTAFVQYLPESAPSLGVFKEDDYSFFWRRIETTPHFNIKKKLVCKDFKFAQLCASWDDKVPSVSYYDIEYPKGIYKLGGEALSKFMLAKRDNSQENLLTAKKAIRTEVARGVFEIFLETGRWANGVEDDIKTPNGWILPQSTKTNLSPKQKESETAKIYDALFDSTEGSGFSKAVEMAQAIAKKISESDPNVRKKLDGIKSAESAKRKKMSGEIEHDIEGLNF